MAAYLVLEYAGGGDLHSLIKERVKIYNETSQTGPIFRDIEVSTLITSLLHGLLYLHDRDVVHRDIKPENILLLASRDLTRMKIADFGLSAQFKYTDVKTLKGKCGTLTYMAPEILEGQAYTKKVDLYSIGIIMWMCLIGS